MADVVRQAGVPFGVVLNRRLCPFSEPIRACLAQASRPVLIEYHWVNAPWGTGWPFDPTEGGGKLVSSGCHMFDYVNLFLDTDPVRCTAAGGRFAYGDTIMSLDSAAVVVQYADGSVASVTTGEMGHKAYPQERLSIFTTCGVVEVDNFVRMRTYGFDVEPIELEAVDKGLGCVLEAMRKRMEGEPTHLADARAGTLATAVAVAASRAVETGQAQAVEGADP